MAAKTRAAIPIIPFIPGPETLNIAMLLRLNRTTADYHRRWTRRSSVRRLRITGIFNQTGIWNWAMGVMVRR